MTDVLRVREGKLLEVRKFADGSVVLSFEPKSRCRPPTIHYRPGQVITPPGGFIITIYDNDVAVLVEDHQLDDPGPPPPA